MAIGIATTAIAGSRDGRIDARSRRRVRV